MRRTVSTNLVNKSRLPTRKPPYFSCVFYSTRFYVSLNRIYLMTKKVLPANVRFQEVCDFLSVGDPAFTEFLPWQTFRSLERFVKDNRLPKRYASTHPSLHARDWPEVNASARLVGKVIDFYVLGFDEKTGIIGIPCLRSSGLLGFLQIIPNQAGLDAWSSDYQRVIRMDYAFTPRPLSECAKLTLTEAR